MNNVLAESNLHHNGNIINHCLPQQKSDLRNRRAAEMSKRRIEIEGTTLGPNATKLAKPMLTPGMKMNPYTALPFTPRYFELFRKRIQLPVWEYQEKFLDLLAKHQGRSNSIEVLA